MFTNYNTNTDQSIPISQSPVNMSLATQNGKKRVRFAPSVTTVDNPCDLQEEDMHTLWYSSEEMITIKTETANDIKDSSLLQEYCISDETYSDQRRQQRQQTRLNVMLQQELLWDDGVEDPDLIAEVYMEDTKRSQTVASQRGIQHARHVLDINGAKKVNTLRRTSNVNEDFTTFVVSCCDDAFQNQFVLSSSGGAIQGAMVRLRSVIDARKGGC